MSALPPVVIAVAPNGAKRGKDDHAALPITPAELAETARAAADAGAAMIHLHVRDEQGRHSLEERHYRPALAAVAEAVGERLIVQATSEAAGVYRPAEQRAHMRALRPAAMSLALREIIPPGDEAEAAGFLAWAAEEGILPQFILYEPAEVTRLIALIEQGVVPWQRPPVLFVLGRYTPGQRSQPSDLLPFLAANRPQFPWMVCAFGAQEGAAGLTAALLGGQVRLGFENNLLLPDGSPAPDNAALIRVLARSLALQGRRPATAAEARRLFNGEDVASNT